MTSRRVNPNTANIILQMHRVLRAVSVGALSSLSLRFWGIDFVGTGTNTSIWTDRFPWMFQLWIWKFAIQLKPESKMKLELVHSPRTLNSFQMEHTMHEANGGGSPPHGSDCESWTYTTRRAQPKGPADPDSCDQRVTRLRTGKKDPGQTSLPRNP